MDKAATKKMAKLSMAILELLDLVIIEAEEETLCETLAMRTRGEALLLWGEISKELGGEGEC